LQAWARRIAGGDLSTRLEVPGDHELAFLARDFNRMAADLSTAQEEVREWSRTLEQKVEEKATELQSAQRQVMHMEKMASLGKLSATVAHEINNPISGVLTYARLVERELADQPLEPAIQQELQRYLQLMQRECTRCGAIVQNLLAFARRTGGDLVLVDVDEVVERSIMLLRHHLEISGISLTSELLVVDREIVADPGQLQQALVALLVNAIEAMQGGGELGVRLRGEPDAVQVEIHDTGVGIDPAVLPQVFEPFFSTKNEQSGAGLGLAVVYGIVHRHGGTINIESSPGRGTTVTFRLPRHPPETAAGAALTAADATH
jgi:two-component system NtrC family sensor kinase